MGVAQQRILAERKNWRKDKPFGFFARPEVQDDGCDCSEGLNFEGALDSLFTWLPAGLTTSSGGSARYQARRALTGTVGTSL